MGKEKIELLGWTAEEPTESGWYWARSEIMSARPVKFIDSPYGCSAHAHLPTNWHNHPKKEYAGPIPEPGGFKLSDRSDEEIVRQTSELTREIGRLNGFTLKRDVKFHDSGNPRIEGWWQMACAIQELMTGTDPSDAVANLEE